jgi:metal regulatory transcription factor 1
MVKHQRRSHQRGIHSSELDDCTSESGSDESPSTPKSNAMHWPPHGVPINPMPHGHGLHRAQSFADFGQMNQFHMQQPYGHRHSLSGGPHDVHAIPMPEQHPGVQMLHRTASMPQQPYYVTETGNPGVATMNTNTVPAQYQVPRQPVDRIAVEIPYSAPGMTASIQSSPSSFSASGRSPSTQDGFYTHQPTQAATYALHAASPVEPQGPMVQYPQSMPQQVPPPQAMSQAPPPTSAPAPQGAYQPPPSQAEGQWYDGVPYQQPVEVPTMGQIPPYGTAVYDPWADPKMEFETAGIPMPSARIEQM